MIGTTIGVSAITAALMDIIFPNMVYSWREHMKARREKKLKMRRSYPPERRSRGH